MATTSEPLSERATVLRRHPSPGTVDLGKNADLVLLADNPIEDSGNLHKIIGVVRGGRHYSPADLDLLKNRIKSNRSVH